MFNFLGRRRQDFGVELERQVETCGKVEVFGATQSVEQVDERLEVVVADGFAEEPHRSRPQKRVLNLMFWRAIVGYVAVHIGGLPSLAGRRLADSPPQGRDSGTTTEPGIRTVLRDSPGSVVMFSRTRRGYVPVQRLSVGMGAHSEDPIGRARTAFPPCVPGFVVLGRRVTDCSHSWEVALFRLPTRAYDRSPARRRPRFPPPPTRRGPLGRYKTRRGKETAHIIPPGASPAPPCSPAGLSVTQNGTPPKTGKSKRFLRSVTKAALACAVSVKRGLRPPSFGHLWPIGKAGRGSALWRAGLP